MIMAYDNYCNIEQPSLVDNFLENLKNLFNKFTVEKEHKQVQIDITKFSKNIHTINADVKVLRDFIDNYCINDIKKDEEILDEYSDLLQKSADKVELSIENIENSKIPNPMKTTILDAYEELYSDLVNTEFTISQKIAQAYLDSKSKQKFLQEA